MASGVLIVRLERVLSASSKPVRVLVRRQTSYYRGGGGERRKGGGGAEWEGRGEGGGGRGGEGSRERGEMGGREGGGVWGVGGERGGGGGGRKGNRKWRRGVRREKREGGADEKEYITTFLAVGVVGAKSPTAPWPGPNDSQFAELHDCFTIARSSPVRIWSLWQRVRAGRTSRRATRA